MKTRSARRLILLSTPILAIVLLAVTQAQRRPAPRAETPYQRLGRVTAWDVNFHMEYQHTNDDGTIERGVSDWTGTLNQTDWSSEDYRGWYGDLSVRVQGKCSGTEKRGDLGFRFYAQGYYELTLGYANLGCTTYSQSWKIKRPLPDQSKILSGQDKLDLTAGPPCAHNCGPNSMALTWNFSPAGTKP